MMAPLTDTPRTVSKTGGSVLFSDMQKLAQPKNESSNPANIPRIGCFLLDPIVRLRKGRGSKMRSVGRTVDQAGVVAAEAKAVFQDAADGHLTGLVGDVVEVAAFVGVVEVDRWRSGLIKQGLHAND